MSNKSTDQRLDGAIAIRPARERDRRALERLASIDGKRRLEGRVLVAEDCSGRIHAAISLDDGRHVADPFRPTAMLVEMLEVRARRARPSGAQSGWRITGRLDAPASSRRRTGVV